MIANDEKYCPKCRQTKSKSAFNKNRRTRDGLQAYCQDCTRAIFAAWRNANRHQFNESTRRSKAKNPEKYRAMRQAWAEAHPDETRAARQRYEAQHPYTTRKGWYQRHYQSNKLRIKMRQTARNQMPRAKQLNAQRARRRRMLKGHKRIRGWPLLRAWFGDCCLCCGATARIEADHVIPLARGGADVLVNLQPLCRTCNASKGVQIVDYRDPGHFSAFLSLYVLVVVWAWWNIPPRPSLVRGAP